MNYVSGDLRDQLAHLGREVVRSGLVVGSGGNLSARLPAGDSCWVTAAGSWLDRLDRDCFAEVAIVEPDAPAPVDGPSIDGADVDGADVNGADVNGADNVFGGGLVPSSEVALHLAAYRARPDVRVVVHLHPQSVLLLDALGESIRLVTTDHAFYLRRVARVPFRLPGSEELAELAATAASDGTNCLVLAQHGCSVLADSVELAHKRATNLEEAARLTYRALLAGRLAELPDAPAAFLDRLEAGPTSV
ncbi:class II aldolase/adducin family protein [Solwaraspora sp. WMMD1047]|uniref:class II aldolase/adducin family protein n=1 Tax=Solwaraspora sp. WMMD1047 TaxID=3016102 RepID=UPI002415CA87|nr:class II aldolase/adducin family protein [Solwaraspora sp. WMMD1047]MDG4834554.1 class II aldolase/adducin family protein [Solwaraspora sp. WMMD1047]